ncbi:HAD family hydrolase [Methanothermococcus sp.]|uniref:HAD family hydrolase n=1 Tax=Methanothermococcus sp. TaxID=2614238 RepID=UPI0025DEE18E|nr:HAD family hydrolase [Methanothermococcus sp.]
MISIPNYKDINAKTVVFDLNGTLAVDGKVDNEIKDLLNELNKKYNIVVLTADTFGTIRREFEGSDIIIEIIKNTEEKMNKAKKHAPYIGVGNGNNDINMLKNAELGIAVIGKEGCSIKTLLSADIVVNNIMDAIYLLLNEKRMIATLRK